MKRPLMAGVAAVAVATAAPAFGQSADTNAADRARTTGQTDCMAQLNESRDRLRNDPHFTQLHNDRDFDRTAYSELIEAAEVLASAGMERHCLQVVNALDEMALRDIADGGTDGRTGDRNDPNRDETSSERPDRTGQDQARQDRAQRDQARQQLESSVTIEQARLSAGDIMGAPIRNMSDEDLGAAEDITVNRGRISSVIVSRGGFLGLGETYYRVSYDRFRVIPGDRPVLVLDMADSAFERMTPVVKQEGDWVEEASADRTTEPGADADTERMTSPQDERSEPTER